MNTSLQRSIRHVPTQRTATWAYACALLAMIGLFLFAEQAKAVDASENAREAKAWLDKIASSAKTVSYEGTFIFRRDDQLVTMHIVHAVDQTGERERLSSLSGMQREFYRSKEGVVCLTPGQKHSTLNREILRSNFPGQIGDGVRNIEKNYRLVMGGVDRIAGRKARMIVIAPKDNYRYGYRVWIDDKTGLLLQSDLVNERGDAIEQFMFTTINVLDKATPQMIQAVTMSDEMRQSLNSSKPDAISVVDARWQIMRMPSGFSLVEHYKRNHGKWGPTDQLVLTDGIAMVSVFVEQVGEHGKPFNGVSHVGAMNAYGATVNDHQLTVVGEVPVATVRLIGSSLRLSVAGN